MGWELISTYLLGNIKKKERKKSELRFLFTAKKARKKKIQGEIFPPVLITVIPLLLIAKGQLIPDLRRDAPAARQCLCGCEH